MPCSGSRLRTSERRAFDAAFVDFTRPACDTIKAQGVKRVVGVTVLGRGHPMADHAGITAHIRPFYANEFPAVMRGGASIRNSQPRDCGR